MRKTLALAAVLVLVAVSVSVIALELSQEHTWGGPAEDEAEDVAVAPDGSVYVTGSTLSFGAGDSDAFLLKYAPDGSLEWQRTYGVAVAAPFFSPFDFGNGVAAAPDGSAYMVGQLSGGNLFLVKFDAGGSMLWQRTWGSGHFARAVEVASDGSVYVAGGTFSFGAGQADALLLKFTPDGTLTWARTWGGASREALEDMAIGPDGSVYLAGETSSFFWNDAFLVKFAPDGTLLWQRDWGTMGDLNPNDTIAWGVGTAGDGSVYITGASNTSRGSVMIVKFDAEGTLLWERVANAAFGTAFDVAAAADGNVYATGFANSGTGDSDAFVMTVLPDGRARESLTWGGGQSDVGESLAVAADGTIVIAGSAGDPPYVTKRGRARLIAPDGYVITPGGTVTAPEDTTGVPLGVATTPNGSTAFAGATDAMMLRLRQ
jgi:uncharacterized delta-60 repeat protein